MVQSGPDGVSQKALKTFWPIDEGLVFGTTRRSGDKDLVPEQESLLLHRHQDLL